MHVFIHLKYTPAFILSEGGHHIEGPWCEFFS